MLETLIITSILALILSIMALSVGLIALVKTMALANATHTVHMEPIEKNTLDEAFSFEDDKDDYKEIPTKDLESMLLKGLE